MMPTFNYILFYFSALFSINSNFVSEQTKITIELGEKTIQIEYIDLKTSERDTKKIMADIKSIKESISFDKSYAQFTLISKEIYKKRNKLNAKLNFKYNNSKDLDYFYFYTDSSSTIRYPVLSAEKITFSNGQFIKSEHVDWIQWKQSANIIKLSIKRLKIDKREQSLLQYFKK